MLLTIPAGTTSKTIMFPIFDPTSSTGALLAGLTYSTVGACYYCFADGSTDVSVTLASKSLGTWTSGGFVAVDGTNMPGIYAFDIPNAALATGHTQVIITFKGSSTQVPVVIVIQLTSVADFPVNVTEYAGTAIASAAAGYAPCDLRDILGTAVSSPATAGILDVNAKNINNVSTSNVTTINANLGETQPINFTGTSISALVKVDVDDWNGTAVSSPATAGIPDINVKNIGNHAVALDGNNLLEVDTQDIAGSVVSTSTAQLGVNLVNIAGSAVNTSAAQIGVNAVNWGGGPIPAPNVTGVPKVDVTDALGNAVTTNSANGVLDVNTATIGTTALNSIFSYVVEGSATFLSYIRIFFSALAGKSNGGGTSTINFRDAGDTKNRITATVDSNGDRTAVTTNGS
jgi:hypothetical protein